MPLTLTLTLTLKLLLGGGEEHDSASSQRPC